ncbi:MAG TPA: transcriptional regulator [Holosporales bacterium]|nr:transcriptional regulator [Holosporales bacterium]
MSVNVGIKPITYALLERQFQHEREEILKCQLSILESGQYILGEVVENLEKDIASFCGVTYCVALNSGTDALIFGMMALGIKKGDEVITPTNSFIASTSSIIHVGAIPVLIDVKEDQNIDVNQIESKITSKTKAIMPVHLTGRIAEMNKIRALAQKYNLFVIEDAAQAFGSQYHGQYAGSFGNVGCFSAHPLKTFNACGDAGFLTTDNKEIYQQVRLLRAHGLQDRNTVVKWGYVSRLDAMQAAILQMRLGKIKGYIEKRRQNLELYRSLLDLKYVFIPPCKPHEYNQVQTFVIQVDKRNELQAHLAECGIQTSVHYPIPIHLQPVCSNLNYKRGDFPQTEYQADRILSVPVSQFLEDFEIGYVSEKINGFFRGK